MATTQSRNRERGKESEKAIAEMLNGKRVGILGSEDVFTEKFSIEVKSRKKFIARNWMKQSEKNSKNKIPLVIVHQTSTLHISDLVIMRMVDFQELNKPLEEKD